MPVDAFDGRSLSDRPPRVGDAPNTSAPAPSLPSAKGTPSLALTASGTDNLRADPKTFANSQNRSTPSGRAKVPAGVDHFADGSV